MLLDKTFCAKKNVNDIYYLSHSCVYFFATLVLLSSLLSPFWCYLLLHVWLLFIITVVAFLYIIFNALSIHENDTLCSSWSKWNKWEFMESNPEDGKLWWEICFRIICSIDVFLNKFRISIGYQETVFSLECFKLYLIIVSHMFSNVGLQFR